MAGLGLLCLPFRFVSLLLFASVWKPFDWLTAKEPLPYRRTVATLMFRTAESSKNPISLLRRGLCA